MLDRLIGFPVRRQRWDSQLVGRTIFGCVMHQIIDLIGAFIERGKDPDRASSSGFALPTGLAAGKVFAQWEFDKSAPYSVSRAILEVFASAVLLLAGGSQGSSCPALFLGQAFRACIAMRAIGWLSWELGL